MYNLRKNNKLIIAGYITLELILMIILIFRHYQIDRIDRKNLKKIILDSASNLDDKLVEIDNLKVDGNTNQKFREISR